MSPAITIRENYILIEPKAGIDYHEIQRGIARLFYVDRIPDRNRIWLFRNGPQKLTEDDLARLKDLIIENYPGDAKVNKTAIVVASDSQSSVVEAFAQIIRELPQKLRVFARLADAELWIYE